MNSRAIAAALGAALLFGASTPFAKALTGDMPPMLLAGLLYLGSGVGLSILRTIRDRGFNRTGLARGEWTWFAGAILVGGVVGPTLLMMGLERASAAEVSLSLNLESVLTAVLAWLVFHENADRRIVVGMLAIVLGGALLAWAPSPRHGDVLGLFEVAGACLCWAIDNNLTRKVSASDALFIAAAKGLAAGLTNVGLALLLGAGWPTWQAMANAATVGFVGYGVSLVLFVLALRDLGAARTGAYFSTAPFIGAAVALVFFHESATPVFWIAGACMAAGVGLHLTERHEHEHTHEPLEHTHAHRHDAHHRHAHAFAWHGEEPHTHEHRHEPVRHAHPHYPDVHHRHSH